MRNQETRMVDSPVEILLVEDNPADVCLTRESLNSNGVWSSLSVAKDGVEAMAYLRRKGKFAGATRPDLILLDLNLPRKDGREVLAEVKADASLRLIPVVILSGSAAEEDVLNAYGLHANCYITKPADLGQFMKVGKSIEDFWFATVRLPSKP